VNAALPAALAFIMFSLGLALRLQDFRAVLQHPRALALGLAAQLLLLPLAGAAVAWAAALPPLLAVGLMVLAACPGGVSSGLLTHLARGDVALSIALTALTSLSRCCRCRWCWTCRCASSPTARAAGRAAAGRHRARIFVLTTLPVLAGMALARVAAARRRQGWCNAGRPRSRRRCSCSSCWLTFWSQRDVLLAQLPRVGAACLALDALVLGAAWFASRAAGLAARRR
jgi:BASS family bile acid:Na+ symporter